MPNNVVVLGYGSLALLEYGHACLTDIYHRAGVSGLTVAYLLSQDPDNKVTVLAKHMPGDYDIEYASPWAGANYMPYG